MSIAVEWLSAPIVTKNSEPLVFVATFGRTHFAEIRRRHAFAQRAANLAGGSFSAQFDDIHFTSSSIFVNRFD